MAIGKTSTLTLRIEPAPKETLRVVAECECHSIANKAQINHLFQVLEPFLRLKCQKEIIGGLYP